MRVAVVGVGGTGSAAARHLAAAGHDVVGYEQFEIGHDRGSSHGASRIIRYTYPDRFYTRLMADAYPLWAALEAEAGEELLVPCGGLYFGRAGHSDLVAIEDALRAGRHAYEALAPDAVRERFPAIRLAPEQIGIYQAESGFLRASRCVAANARLARGRGATLVERAAVRDVAQRGSEVVVRLDSGEERAFDRAIVTAGPWIGALFARLGLPLRVTRQVLVYLRPSRNAAQFEPGHFPVWIDADTFHYGCPSDGAADGPKIGAHRGGEETDPDRVRRDADDATIGALAAYATQRFPDLSGDVALAQVCLYTSTPDEDFIVDRAPDAPNVWLVSGCSGHGFKFTVLLGKIAAELATGATATTGGNAARDLSRFALSRFDR